MAAFAVVTHAGQGCAITTRLLVPREKLADAIKATGNAMAGLAANDPTDPRNHLRPTDFGDAAGSGRVGHQAGRRRGGTIEVGGGRPADKDKGFYVQPTLISGLDNSAQGRAGGDLRPGPGDHRPRR